MKPGTETAAGAMPPGTGKGGKKEGRKWEKAVPNLRCFPNNGVVSRLFPAFPAISHLFPHQFLSRGRKPERRATRGLEVLPDGHHGKLDVRNYAEKLRIFTRFST